MNYYEHHMGDWAKKCAHLSCLEEGVYRRALDWYYTHERPLPLSIEELTRQLRLQDDLERDTLRRVMQEFFEHTSEGWIHARVEREIRKFHNKAPLIADHKEGLRLRNQRARERRKAAFELLREAGYVAPWNTSLRLLLKEIESRGLTLNDTAGDTASGAAYDTGSGFRPDTANHTPSTINTGLSGKPLDLKENPEARALCVRAIREAGFTQANPQDPRLIALVSDGATPGELAVIAAEAAALGKGWNWLLAVAKGRREDAKRPQEGPKSARQRAAEARVREWTPELLQIDPGGHLG